MTRYPYLLFDADNTLFDFDEANVHAFRAVCDAFGLPFSQELFAPSLPPRASAALSRQRATASIWRA